jgi:putative SOS response-associated peptidase YedK
MCGRFVSTTPAEVLAATFAADVVLESPHARWNIAPGAKVPVVVERSDADGTITRAISTYSWGLIPSWAKDAKIGNKLTNARSETVAEKPSFRRAFAKRRCIIPADGFYEWHRASEDPVTGKPRKLPYFIHRLDGQPLAFAGLWEAWRDPEGPEDGELIRSCTIITTSANEAINPVHDRMPVVLAEDDWATWLSPEPADTAELTSLLRPAPSEWFELYRVDTAVNSSRSQGDQLMVRLGVDAEDPAGVNKPPLA